MPLLHFCGLCEWSGSWCAQYPWQHIWLAQDCPHEAELKKSESIGRDPNGKTTEVDAPGRETVPGTGLRVA